MGTILEPPGETQDNSIISSKIEARKLNRKYSETLSLQNDRISSDLECRAKIVASNSLINPTTENKICENSSNTDDANPKDNNIEEVDEKSDSSNDADKFLKAAQENASSKASDTKVYTKLATEVLKIQKGTLDMENLMPKKTANTPGKEYEIKRGYYSKLGIDRPSNRPSAFKFYPPIKKVIKEEEEIGKLRKSSSSELKTDAPLEEKEEEEKSTQNKNTTESQKIYEEGKIDDGKANKSSTAQNILGKSKRKIKARDRNRKLSMLDTPNQVPVESYETKESGNWRIDLLNTPIMARSGDRIRQDLLKKPDSHQTVFIYDWDDTLLCTTFLNPTGFYDEDVEIPEIAIKHLEKLEKAVEKLITSSVKLGKVYIVTNAAEGWVQFSSKKYMPKVYKALKNVEIISARSLYEQQFPGDSYEWKMQAFTNIQKALESSMITNIIACGDSRIEMEAARHIAKLFKTAFIKTVKFKETPTPEELIKQLNLVMQKLEHISSAPRNLTIRLERKGK